MWIVPLSAVAFGFCIHYGANLAAVLVTQFFIGFGQSLVMPAILGELRMKMFI